MVDTSQHLASVSVESLASATQRYNEEVGELRGPLELEVAEAVSVCWVEENGRTVQARGKFGLRTKSVHVHEKTFLEEAERKVLSGALSQWQRKAEGDAAAAALGVGIAEARLLHASSRVLEESAQKPAALLTLLDRLLSSIAGTGAPALLSSPSAFSTLRSLCFLVAARYQSAVGGQPNCQLLEVLLRYAGVINWASATLQPLPSQIPSLLPVLVQSSSPASMGDDPSTKAGGCNETKAQVRLLLQLPWESADTLTSEQISGIIIPNLLAMAGRLGQEPRADIEVGSDDAELATLIAKVLEMLALAHAHLRSRAYGAVLLCALCLARGSTVAEVTGTLDMPGQDILEADILNVAQLVWSSPAAEHPKAALAAQVLQNIDWEMAVPQLPQALRLRLLLTLLAVYRGLGSEQPTTTGGIYFAWVWNLLEGPLGATLTHLGEEPGSAHDCQAADAERGANEVHMLCMTEAPAAREDVLALWAWLRAHLALGLLERWAAADKTQAAGHADALLEGMQFFSLPMHLINISRPQAVIGILLRFFDVALATGEPFFRSKLQDMAMMFTEAAQKNSTSDVFSPIREALHVIVHDGVAAAEATQPRQASPLVPAAVPSVSPGRREPAAPKRGSTISPGPEALSLAACWLALLSCAAARGSLPAPALVLMSDLVQLLYYHGPPAPNASSITTDRGRAGSPTIQECMEAIKGAIGMEGAQRLWVPLLKQHSANPVNLQWLPLLACWLSSTAGAEVARQQRSSAQTRPKSRSSSPKKPNSSPRRHGQEKEEEGHKAASPAAADRNHLTGGEEDGGVLLDRNAEEALQLQEAAMRVGYGAAALPMWEEFLSRYFHYLEQLEPITPCAEISAHLAELSHLYEASCPVLSNIYMLLAPLSPESLPGGHPNFIAGNTEALCALMQLHPLKLGKSQKVQTPEAVAPPADQDSISSLRKAAIPPAAYEEVLKQQDDIASRLVSSAALLRSWSHRREKRQAAATPPHQAQHSSAADNSESDSEAPSARNGDMQDLDTLTSPCMSQGSLDGDVPQIISQAQAKLWEGLSCMAEHLDNLNAVIRELVVRRYKPADIKRIEAGEYGDVDDIPADEDPEFQLQYQKNREAALAAVMEFLTGKGVAGAARLLYEVEVLLLGPPFQEDTVPAKGGKGVAVDVADAEQSLSCKAQLLAVLGESILDESMPAAAVPFLIDLFAQSAHRLLPKNPTLKVELVGRLMAAFASRGQGVSREADAVALLSAGLGSQQLLAEGRLAEYNGCLSCVLEACPKLPPSAVGRLLACFDLGGFSAALLHRGTPESISDQVQLGGRESGSAGAEKPSPAAARILGLTVDALAAAGGEAAGVELLAGLLAAGGHAAYFDACLAVVLGARGVSARDAGLTFLTRLPFEALPIDVTVEAMVQVTDDLNQAESARREVPYALIQKLIQAPCSLSALRQVIATGTGELLEGSRDGQATAWTATLSDSASQPDGPGGGSSSSGAPVLKISSAQVMLLAVQPRGDAVARIELLIGACLQSILRRFGSGLDGMSMTEELTQLLAVLLEPVGVNHWLVDWLWALYKEAFQPFLVLAGPASDGAATRRFRECWACLPWHRATFHCINPGGLAELVAYLLAPDRGALDLLHALPWEPILQRLALAARPGAGPLPADAQQWATQLSLLSLQALVLLPMEHLPGWLVGLTASAAQDGGPAADDVILALRLPHIIAAADPHALQEVLCNCVEGLPFLLQPLVDAPSLLQGDPGPRLLQVAGLLTAAAKTSTSAAVAAMAASVILGLMFTSVCRGFISGKGHSPHASPAQGHGTTEVIECWHLTAEEHSLLVTECLLPLCLMHAPGAMQAASILLRPDAKPRGSPDSSETTPQAALAGWRAPQLSQLVDRLGSHAAATFPSQPAPNGGPEAPKVLRGSRLAVLGPANQGNSSALQPAGDNHDCTMDEQYIAASVPANALLSCLTAHPRTVLTADPLPFANAETPLRGPPSEPAHQDQDDASMRDGAGSDAASTAGSEAKPDFMDKAISMAQRLKIQRRGKRAPTRQRLLQAEAADLQTIQSHIAALIEDSCQHRGDDLPLSIMRVGFTCAPLRRLPLGSALLEDLVQSLLLRHSAAAPPAAPSESDGSGAGRQRSYTEQALAAPVNPSGSSAADLVAGQAEAAAAPLLRTLEGLGDGAVAQICADAADARTPLVQALASEKARRATALDERASWRHNVSQVLRAASAAEARPGAPCHIAAVWLAALLWLEDARWRKLRSGGAPTDALEGLLDALSRRVLLLNLPPPAHEPAPTTPSGAGSDAFEAQPRPSGSAQAPDGGKTLTRLTQQFKRMLPSGKGGLSSANAAEAAQDGSAPQRKGVGRLKARFLSKEPATVDIPPSSFDYETSMGFPEVQGPRFGRLDPIPSGDSEAGSSRPQTPSRGSEYGSPPGSPEETQQRRGFAGLFVRTPSTSLSADVPEHRAGETSARQRPARDYAARLADDVKKALTGGKKAEAAAAEAAAKEAEAKAAAEAATDVVIRLGLAAFAVSAYIKTVLCPSLSSYTPRMSSASLAADLASSGGAFAAAVVGAQLQRQSASLGSLASVSASGTPRLSHLSTPSASLDKLQREDLLMHELDQVLEARAELDSLEEIARCPLVAARADQYRSFFAAAPQLLQPAASVRHFQRALVQLLFPDAPFICAWACLPPAVQDGPKKGGTAL